MPADGAKLSYYISAFHPDLYAEHYSFYVVEDISCLDEGNVDPILANYQPLVEETINIPSDYNADHTMVGGWINHVVDLNYYAGKTIYLVYRHHDCEGQYVLRLDDVFVYTNEKFNELGISMAPAMEDVASQEYFNIDGVRQNGPTSGVNIIRSTMKDGSVKIQKVILK